MDATDFVYVTPIKKLANGKWFAAAPKRDDPKLGYSITKNASGEYVACDWNGEILVSGVKGLKAMREALSFTLTAIDYCLSLGAVPEDNAPHRLTVESQFGLMRISVYHDMIHCRFENAKSAAEGINHGLVNEYSGKYNCHFFASMGEDNAAKFERLVSHLDPCFSDAEENIEEPVNNSEAVSVSGNMDATIKEPTIPETFTVTLSKGELQALLDIACKEPARVSLFGVAFWYGAAAATDGHAAMLYSDHDKASWGNRDSHLDSEKAAVFLRPGLEAAAKASKRSSEIEICTASDKATVYHVDRSGSRTPAGTFPLQRMEYRFPAIRQIVPKVNDMGTGATTVIGWRADLLGRICDSLSKASGQRLTTLRFSLPAEGLDATRIDFEDFKRGRTWTSVLMPVRL